MFQQLWYHRSETSGFPVNAEGRLKRLAKQSVAFGSFQALKPTISAPWISIVRFQKSLKAPKDQRLKVSRSSS
jgi:hypothetical protein